jgi:hypothetical protein
MAVTFPVHEGKGAQALVSDRWDGIGVYNSAFLDADELNSSLFVPKGDRLELSFDRVVTLKSLSCSQWENDHLFNNFDHALLTWGNQAKSALTAFRLAGIEVASPATAVPEAGTWAMWALGLAGVAAVTRRGRSSQG